jgi:hypothetical protein
MPKHMRIGFIICGAANQIAWFLLELDDVAKIVALKTRTAKEKE